MAQGFQVFDKEWQKDEYWKKEEVLQKILGEKPVSTHEFYRDMFPEGSLEMPGESGKGRAMIREKWWDAKTKSFYVKGGPPHFVYDDLAEYDRIAGLNLDCKFFSPPCSFFGEHMSDNCSHSMFAIVCDIDKLTAKHFEMMVNRMFMHGVIPPPANYVVNSGGGMHVVYLLEEPVPLYQNLHKIIREIKFQLVSLVCASDFYVTKEEMQDLPVAQGHTVVGSNGTLGKGYPATAYRLPFPKWTIEKLIQDYMPNDTVQYKQIMDVAQSLRTTPLDKAKELWPGWYQERIVDGKKIKPGTNHPWTCHPNMYHKFYNKIRDKGQVRHRFHCIYALAVCGIKCNIPFEQVKQDAYSLQEILSARGGKEDPLTNQDIEDGLKGYARKNITVPVSSVEHLTAISLTEGKRKRHKPPLPLNVRIQIASSTRDALYPDGSWRNTDGRPAGSGTAQNDVLQWRAKHPDGTKSQCKNETGLSYPTIRKWWECPVSQSCETGHLDTKIDEGGEENGGLS